MVLSGEITSPRAWPRNDSPAADEFGPYAIHEQLGIGGMATVHRAERRVAGVRQRVALKRMLPTAAADPDLVKLFFDEARLVSQLRHRNIAEVYDFGTVGEDYFLAMELVAGPTLKQLVRHCAATVGLIPYPIAVNLLIQVCDALTYAHDRTDPFGNPLGLVHRDVSPSNIVISSNGVVKLIDFGIAKTRSTHTQIGIIKGKLGYIAPEYLEDAGLDRRADLWAVGVIAYELLCNQRLFTGDDDFEVMRLVRTQPITPPRKHNPDIPPELEAIVMTALERDPALRWQNATALRNALAGGARASTNAEVMEWVEWVFTLPSNAARPVRGSRPLAAQPDLVDGARPEAFAAQPTTSYKADGGESFAARPTIAYKPPAGESFAARPTVPLGAKYVDPPARAASPSPLPVRSSPAPAPVAARPSPPPVAVRPSPSPVTSRPSPPPITTRPSPSPAKSRAQAVIPHPNTSRGVPVSVVPARPGAPSAAARVSAASISSRPSAASLPARPSAPSAAARPSVPLAAARPSAVLLPLPAASPTPTPVPPAATIGSSKASLLLRPARPLPAFSPRSSPIGAAMLARRRGRRLLLPLLLLVLAGLASAWAVPIIYETLSR